MRGRYGLKKDELNIVVYAGIPLGIVAAIRLWCFHYAYKRPERPLRFLNVPDRKNQIEKPDRKF